LQKATLFQTNPEMGIWSRGNNSTSMKVASDAFKSHYFLGGSSVLATPHFSFENIFLEMTDDLAKAV
jgi:hypothetical protein